MRPSIPPVIPSVIVTALLALAGGCTFTSDFNNTQYRCDEGVCPDGYTCVVGVCQADPEGGDGGGGDGGTSTQSTCGTLDVLYEGFDAPDLDEDQWYSWADDGIDIDQVDGRLVFQLAPGISDVGGAAGTENGYLLQDTRVFVEVPELDPSADLYVGIELWVTDDTRVWITEHAGALRFHYLLAGEEFEPVTLPYDPVAHRWWQLREEGGTLYHETSPDGVEWTTHVETPSEPFSRVVWLEMGLWLSDGEARPLTVAFDSVNGGAASEVGWCPAADFSDDFADGERDPEWGDWDTGAATLDERNGELVFDYSGAGYGDAGYYTERLFDLERSSATVEVTRLDESIDLVLGLYLLGDDYFELVYTDGQLICFKRIGGISTEAANVAYDPVAHRWWRFQGEGGALHYQVSADGVAWNTIVSHTAPAVSLGAAEIDLWTEGAPNEPLSPAVAFDNFNLPPE